MTRLTSIGGAYQSRSIIASCTRCVNLFPESNPKDALVPITYYQRPGLRLLAQGPKAVVRGLYRASNGNGYCVIGQIVYSISQNWQLVPLGKLFFPLLTPVSMIDNGVELMLVDSSSTGYQIILADNTFSQIEDPTGTFVGGVRCDVMDTFFLWSFLNSPTFGSSLSNELTFDPLYTAAKSVYPDLLQTLICNRHEFLLLGTLKSEIWYDAGNPQFPFALLPGAYIEHGCVAPYSAASADICVFWLGQDLQGQGIVFQQRGYETKRISNHALEYALGQIVKKGGTLSDAIGYTYQQEGHVFYVLCFPSGDQTWTYDLSINDPTLGWSQRTWTDSQGILHRDRTNCCAFINGQNVVGDWENGALYAMDLDHYLDDVGGTPGPISYIRTFQHWASGNGPGGQLVPADGKRLQIKQFIADIECGNGPLEADGSPAKIGLRWSIDRGKTFGNTVLQSSGLPAEWVTSPKWPTLGIARDPVLELSYSIAGKAALNGGWVEAQVLPT